VDANTVPGAPWTVGVLDTDGTPNTAMAPADTDDSSLHTTVNTVATSWSVDINEGPLWTTTAANYPLDIECDGEVVTVTAVSGGASPQTFTVTRSVNGVVKGHTAGAAIRVAHPLTVTL
jgi:hypothetical protein